MGFFDEIKKVLFGAKAVTKSAADKVVQKGKETAAEVYEKSEEVVNKAADKVEDVGEIILDKAEETWDKAVDKTEEIGATVLDKGGDLIEDFKGLAEDVGEKILDKTRVLGDEVKEKSDFAINKVEDLFDDPDEETGEKINLDLDQELPDSENLTAEDSIDADSPVETDDSESDVTDQIKEDIGNLGSTVLETKSQIVEKAKELAKDLEDKLDETISKAEEMAKEDQVQPVKKSHTEALREDQLDDKDDFFKKAEAFAEGRYGEVTGEYSKPKPKITKIEESNKKEGSSAPLPGFEDLDGDGNEIVDDALIVDDDE